jgi:serine protease inhibitor
MKNLSLFLVALVLVYLPGCFSLSKYFPFLKKQCFSQGLKPSYSCCKKCNILYSDERGDWGIENRKWCGIKYKCYKDKDEKPVQDDTTIESPIQNNTATNNFEFSFLKIENKKKNMLYSPLSIEYALHMLQEGASGNTYTEINKVIGNKELTKYKSIEKVLSLANGLFIRDTYYEGVKKEYIKTLEEKYEADVVKEKFEDAQNTNEWIEDKTLGIIKNMIKDDLVQDPNMVMLIINALAIDMEWAKSFSADKTYGETFYLDNGKEMTATMLFNKEVSSKAISYYKSDDLTVLNMDLLDYDGIQFEFMAIMPKENLSAFVENVTKEQINEIEKKLKLSSDVTDGVNVKIPKFKFNYDLDLKEDLKKLGINDAFNDRKANFSNMAKSNDIYVSDALHRADIEFTEKGVKAAAVTVFAMNLKSMPRPKNPVIVTIDKPFMFIIRDKNTKDIWFTGTLYEPNSWKDDKEDYEKSF